MISTSILYCNKLDALPFERKHHSSGSTANHSLISADAFSSVLNHDNFRVKYLGVSKCNINCTKLKNGISSIQKSLLQVYSNARRKSIIQRNGYPLALNQVIDICSYGVVVAEADPTIIRINQEAAETVVSKVITPLSNILLWAAVRFNTRPLGRHRGFGAAFVPISCSDAVLNRKSFVPLSSKQKFLVGLTHPPLFVCVLQKVSSPKILECHMFVCGTAEDAINICSLLGDTQRHCSKIGALELPPPGHMGSYSYKSSSIVSSSPDGRSNSKLLLRSVGLTSDTQSDSSRMMSANSANSFKTSSSHLSKCCQYKYLNNHHNQLQHDLSKINNQKKIQTNHPHERKTQIKDIHIRNARNAPLFHSIQSKLDDYRYQFVDGNITNTSTTPTASSASEKHHHYHRNNQLREKQNQRYQSRIKSKFNHHHNNNSNMIMKKRFFQHCNIDSGKEQRCSDANSGLTSCTKCDTSSDSYCEECDELRTKDKRSVIKSSLVNRFNHYFKNNDNNNCDAKCTSPMQVAVNNINNHEKDVERGPRNIYNGYYVDDDHNGVFNYEKNENNEIKMKQQQPLRVYKLSRSIVPRHQLLLPKKTKLSSVNKHPLNLIVNGDSSLESSSNSEIVVKSTKNVLYNNHKDNKTSKVQKSNHVHCVPIEIHNKPIENVNNKPSQHRYFGDTIRATKSLSALSIEDQTNHNNNAIELNDSHFKNATTSCADAPWNSNKVKNKIDDKIKKKQQMIMSETIFLGSESDSKCSTSTIKHTLTNGSTHLKNLSESSPELVSRHNNDDNDNVFNGDDNNVCVGGKAIKLVPVQVNGSANKRNYKLTKHSNPNGISNNRSNIKCIKSFNNQSDIKQWSTLSLNSDLDVNQNNCLGIGSFQPQTSWSNFVYNSAFLDNNNDPIIFPTPRFIHWNSHENFTRNPRSGLLTRLRKSFNWFRTPRTRTSKFFVKLKRSTRKRKNTKNYSNTSFDSAVDVQDVSLPRASTKYQSKHNLLLNQKLSSLRRQQSWSFQDFTQRYFSGDINDKLKKNLSTETTSSSSSSSSSPSPVYEKKCASFSNLVTNECENSFTKIPNRISNCDNITNGNANGQKMKFNLNNNINMKLDQQHISNTNQVSKNITKNNSQINSNGNSMSSDSGILEEFDGFTSQADMTVNSSLKSLAKNPKDYNYHSRHLQRNNSKDIINHNVNDQQFNQWSKTNIHQELGYIP